MGETIHDLPDTIDISDDETQSQWSIKDDEYSCFFNTYEDTGFITLSIYYTLGEVNEESNERLIELILKKNFTECVTGQFQITVVGEISILRYLTAINVQGTYSEDPDYEGDFQISPMLFENMYNIGIDLMDNNKDDFMNCV